MYELTDRSNAQVLHWPNARVCNRKLIAKALVGADIIANGVVALTALWFRALPALELLRVASSAGEAGRGNVGANILAASGASGRWWGEWSDKLGGAWGLESLLDNLLGWSGNLGLLNVGVGLLVGDALLLLQLLLLLLDGDLGGSWKENAWLESARAEVVATKSVWNSCIELGSEVVVQADVSIVSLSDGELLEALVSAAVCALAMIDALRC